MKYSAVLYLVCNTRLLQTKYNLSTVMNAARSIKMCPCPQGPAVQLRQHILPQRHSGLDRGAGPSMTYKTCPSLLTLCQPLPNIHLLGADCKVVSVPEMGYDASGRVPRGELLLAGPCLFSGYYRAPEETRKVLSEEGWFRTGGCAQAGNSAHRQVDLVVHKRVYSDWRLCFGGLGAHLQVALRRS